MTFESEGLLIVAIYIWLPPASYVVFSDNSGLTSSPKSAPSKIQIQIETSTKMYTPFLIGLN